MKLKQIARRLRLFPLSPSSSSPLVSHSRLPSSTADVRLSAFHERLLPILRSEIKCEIRSHNSDRQVPTRFSSFNVEDRPGEQWIRMRRRFGAKEDVKVDATMFDGFTSGSSGAISDELDGYGKLHISVVVEVSKGEDPSNGVLQFVCSCWSDSFSIKKVLVQASFPAKPRPFVQRDFKTLDTELQEALIAYLEERGVNDELAAFLHDHMTNKDRIEYLLWMKNITTYLETAAANMTCQLQVQIWHLIQCIVYLLHRSQADTTTRLLKFSNFGSLHMQPFHLVVYHGVSLDVKPRPLNIMQLLVIITADTTTTVTSLGKPTLLLVRILVTTKCL